jgi:hypothetical protein
MLKGRAVTLPCFVLHLVALLLLTEQQASPQLSGTAAAGTGKADRRSSCQAQ